MSFDQLSLDERETLRRLIIKVRESLDR
jgi:hypothetical protein